MGSSFNRPTLAQVAAVAGVVAGLLMTVPGLGLSVALLSTAQPSSQLLTAVVLTAAGAVILSSSRGIRSQQARSVHLGLLVTAIFLAYSGVVLRDFGELFWMAAVFLVLLTTLLRSPSRPGMAA